MNAHFDLASLLTLLLPLAFVVYWLVDLEKDISNFVAAPSRDTFNPIFTKVSAWLAAFVVLNVVAHSAIDLGGDKSGPLRDFLSRLGASDLALIAVVIAAGGGAFADWTRTRNNADTTVKSKLLPPR